MLVYIEEQLIYVYSVGFLDGATCTLQPHQNTMVPLWIFYRRRVFNIQVLTQGCWAPSLATKMKHLIA